MRLASRAVARLVACVVASSLAACSDDEPPLPDSGIVDASDGALSDGTVGTDGHLADVAHKDGSHGDVTTADHHVADTGMHQDVTNPVDGQAVDAGTCGTGPACASGSVCVSGACAPCGTPGESCCADVMNACGTGAACGTDSYCEACGGPGQACCGGTATACASGGCCDLGVCTPSGSACPGSGGLCKSSSCGGACPDGGCGACGAAGQSCCTNIGCTASLELVCETDGGRNVCAVCGAAGSPCCAAGGSPCESATLACSAGGVCVECGGTGEPTCS